MNELGNTHADKNYKPSGISGAESRALEAYPVTMFRRRYDGIARSDDPYDSNLHDRYCFQRGYEQAEKDLAPLIEAATIVYEAWNGGTMDDVRREMVELGKRIMEVKK